MNASEDLLITAQQAQLATIPFENFDILLGLGLSLDRETLCNKLLQHRRGGYCFELNGLLLFALGALGFDARPLLARVHIRGGISPRTHQITLVNINGRNWIADAGFGGYAIAGPLRVEPGSIQKHGRYEYRLQEIEPWGLLLQGRSGDEWQDLYSYDLGHVTETDIAMSNHYTATHPDSTFTNFRVAAIHQAGTSTTLFEKTITVRDATSEKSLDLPDSPLYLEALTSHFGIVLDTPYSRLKPLLQAG